MKSIVKWINLLLSLHSCSQSGIIKLRKPSMQILTISSTFSKEYVCPSSATHSIHKRLHDLLQYSRLKYLLYRRTWITTSKKNYIISPTRCSTIITTPRHGFLLRAPEIPSIEHDPRNTGDIKKTGRSPHRVRLPLIRKQRLLENTGIPNQRK